VGSDGMIRGGVLELSKTVLEPWVRRNW